MNGVMKNKGENWTFRVTVFPVIFNYYDTQITDYRRNTRNKFRAI